MSVLAGQSLTADFTVVGSTGALVNGDSLPTGTLVINGTDDAASVTVTNKATGIYKAAVTVPATVAIGDVVQIRVTATVSSVASGGYIFTDVVDVSDVLYSSAVHSTGFIAATTTQYGFSSSTIAVASGATGGMKGRLFSIISGTGAGTDRVISGSSSFGSNFTLTFEVAMEFAPDATSVWVIKRGRYPKLDSSLRVTTTAAGSGASVVTITVNDGTDPIEGAIVALTSNGVLNGWATTNASGIAPLTPDSGDITYTVAIAKAQHTFTPTTLAVSGATAHTYSMSTLTITPASDPDQTTAYLTTRDGHGTAKASVAVGFRLIKGPGAAGNSYDTAQFTATSDGSGLLRVKLLRDATYVGIRGDGREFEFVTGTESIHLLPENLGVDDA